MPIFRSQATSSRSGSGPSRLWDTEAINGIAEVEFRPTFNATGKQAFALSMHEIDVTLQEQGLIDFVVLLLFMATALQCMI